jgi:predicted transcriptional regulator
MNTKKADFEYLAALIEEEERDQQTREGMTDVEAGCVIDHLAVQEWADGLDRLK